MGDLFCKGFRKNGTTPLNRYMGFYMGRTGVVFNVTKSSVGVVVNKIINGRMLKKRVNIRVEHVHPSKCRIDFLARVKANEVHKQAVRDGKAKKKALKRL